MDLLQYSEVESLLLNLVGDDLPETYHLLGSNNSRRRKWAILRGKAIEHLTNTAARAFVAQQEALLAGSLPGDLVEHMHGTAKRCVLDAKDMARKRMFQDKRKNLHEIGAYTSLEMAVSRNKCNSQLIFLSMLITKLGIPASETSLPLGV